jgi:hypothetical protein
MHPHCIFDAVQFRPVIPQTTQTTPQLTQTIAGRSNMQLVKYPLRSQTPLRLHQQQLQNSSSTLALPPDVDLCVRPVQVPSSSDCCRLSTVLPTLWVCFFQLGDDGASAGSAFCALFWWCDLQRRRLRCCGSCDDG